MNRWMSLICLVVAIGAWAWTASRFAAQSAENGDAQTASSESPDAAQPGADQQAAVERGRYLVHDVAMCVHCHTPRVKEGRLDESKLLRGARIPVPAPDDGDWALYAPNIAGLPGGWSAEGFEAFLRDGKRPTGGTARRPMPPYRFNRRDAAAVAAYVASLPRQD